MTALEERVKNIKVGHPLDPGTELGPLVHAEHFDKVMSYMEVAEKGRCHRRGRRRTARRPRPRKLRHTDSLFERDERHACRERRDLRAGAHRHPVRRRSGCDSPRERHGVRPRRLSVDQRYRPGDADGARSRSRHAVGQLGEQPELAVPVPRDEELGHRPRWGRLELRLLHGNEKTCASRTARTRFRCWAR